jgi:hypothetical protein
VAYSDFTLNKYYINQSANQLETILAALLHMTGGTPVPMNATQGYKQSIEQGDYERKTA